MFASPRLSRHPFGTLALICGLTVILSACDLGTAPQSTPVPASTATGATKYDITNFDYPNSVGTTLFAIGNDGRIAGFYSKSESLVGDIGHKRVRGFVWQSNVRDLGASLSEFVVPQSDENAAALAIGPNGEVLGYFIDKDEKTHAYMRSADGKTFTVIDHPKSAGQTLAFGMNKAGLISGFYIDSGKGVHGYVRSADGNTFTDFDHPKGTGTTYGQSINEAGQVVGHYTDSTGFHAFVRSADGKTFTDFEHPQAKEGTSGLAINKAGEVAGFYIDGDKGVHGYTRSADGKTFSTIDDPKGVGKTYAFGMNDAGQVVGYYVDDKGNNRGFIASPAP
ncbi:MAG TPA: hypothetical protein VGE04_16105 [Chloroflexia bacterium]